MDQLQHVILKEKRDLRVSAMIMAKYVYFLVRVMGKCLVKGKEQFCGLNQKNRR